MDKWRRQQSDWLTTNFSAVSLLSITGIGVGRPESCPPRWTAVEGWPWLRATIPCRHYLTLFRGAVEENRTRKLMGQDKDRVNICQLVSWAKNYLLLIRIDSGSEKQRQTLNQQSSSTLSSQTSLPEKIGGLANGGCGSSPPPPSHFPSVPVWPFLMIYGFLQRYPSTCSRMRSSTSCREIPAPARVFRGLQGNFHSCTCSTSSFFCVFALEYVIPKASQAWLMSSTVPCGGSNLQPAVLALVSPCSHFTEANLAALHHQNLDIYT